MVVDPDPARRERFVAEIGPKLHLLPGLISGACRSGEFHAVWAAAPAAPVGAVADASGAAVVVGAAVAPDSGARITPAELRRAWRVEAQPAAWRTWDGYFAAVAFDRLQGIVAGADLLGMFPLYHWSDGEVLLVASSPETFRYHPAFRPVFDPAALVGIMLTNGLVRNRALWAGVRRLPAAHFLRCRRGAAATEHADAELAASLSRRTGSDLSLAEQLDTIDAAFSDAARRHVAPGEACGILLSGGLDSRLVAGYLHRQHTPLVAMTLGVPRDIEMRCARGVARELEIEHRTGAVAPGLYPAFAEALTARWEHLANGGEVVFNWGTPALMTSFPSAIATGTALDWLIGGSYDFGVEPGRLTFDRGFATKINSRGFPPPLLRRLLRREVFDGVAETVLDEMRADFEGLAEDPLRRFWRFFLLHRARFTAGSMAWQLSFGAWPVLLALDRRLIATVTSLPLATMEDRKAEQALLCRRFPALARLPLDRNGYLTTPLPAGAVRRFAERVPAFVRTRWLAPRLGPAHERRYYYRVFDLNNDGWVGVRRAAEPFRDRLKGLFVPEVLDEILPPPDRPVRYRGDLINEGSRLKQLLVLALWAENRL